jgi:phage host-nuclease inhibitor protein Gam
VGRDAAIAAPTQEPAGLVAKNFQFLEIETMARTKTNAAKFPVTSQAEASEAIAVIGDLGRKVELIDVKVKAETAALKLAAEAIAKPLGVELKARLKGLQAWAESNRGDLTKDGKRKYFDLAGGRAGWRLDPMSVSLKGLDGIIAKIRSNRKLKAFLRTSVAIDKEAMLRDEDT